MLINSRVSNKGPSNQRLESQQKSSPRCPTTCGRIVFSEGSVTARDPQLSELSKKRNQSGFIVEIGNTSRIPDSIGISPHVSAKGSHFVY